MFWEIILSAVALVLVIEGIVPFAAPGLWKRAMYILACKTELSIRIMGFISLLSGAILMYLVHSGIL